MCPHEVRHKIVPNRSGFSFSVFSVLQSVDFFTAREDFSTRFLVSKPGFWTVGLASRTKNPVSKPETGLPNTALEWLRLRRARWSVVINPG
jgi:hypothetical protein